MDKSSSDQGNLLDCSSGSDNDEKPKSEEEMKAEAMEQLKKIGDFCLRPFGISTNDFQMVPEPGGGYSIQMKQNEKK